MSIITGSFTTTEQTSTVRIMTVGNRLIVSLWGSWTGAIRVMSNGVQLAALSANGNYEYKVTSRADVYLHAAMVSSGTVKWRIEEANDFIQVGNLEWDDLRFPAQGINPAGAVAAPTVETDEALFPGSLIFSSSADQMIAGIAQMPHEWAQGTPLRPHIHWMQTGIDAGKPLWHFYYRLSNRGTPSGAWVGPIVGEDELSTGGVADQEGITTFRQIDMPPVTSKVIGWRVYRMAADPGDTLGTTARFLEFDIHYQKDSIGSGAEFFK